MGIVAMRNARISSGNADVLITPRLRGFGSFELKRAQELIEVGHDAAEEAIPAIRHALEHAAETPAGWRRRLQSVQSWWRGGGRRTA